MFYIVNRYEYHVYDDKICQINILASAKTINEIKQLAKRINQDERYEKYFGYCNYVGIYEADELTPPYEFKNMEISMTFNEALR